MTNWLILGASCVFMIYAIWLVFIVLEGEREFDAEIDALARELRGEQE